MQIVGFATIAFRCYPIATHWQNRFLANFMIEFVDVSKSYHIGSFHKHVLRGVDFTILPGDSLGICGANGAGKSTLMRMIAGVERPSGGTVRRAMTTSWPIGNGAAFQTGLTGADNIRFIARIYGRDEEEMLDFVEGFAELGSYLHQPVRTYSAGMNSRLNFGTSLAIEFECYLVDEVTSAGDDRFRERSEAALSARREAGTLIMVSHDTGTLQRYCSRGAVLYGGTLTFYDSITEAADVHHRLQTLAPLRR